LHEPRPLRRTLAAAEVPKMLGRGGPSRRDVERPARFAVGDSVRARVIHPRTHTRLPRYVRGHVGTVVHVHGAHVYPDAHAHGGGEDPQWLYTVRFEGRELWGPDADPASAVSVDAFEPYLEPAA
jgi:nitrile hydratase